MSIRLRLILLLTFLLVLVTMPLAAQEQSGEQLRVHRNTIAGQQLPRSGWAGYF